VSAGVTFNVNITGQTANVNIDIKAQSVAIKGLTDWAAENATDIDATGSVNAGTAAFWTCLTYTVPSGKTLLIYNWEAALLNGDGQVAGFIYDDTTSTFLCIGGGQRGFSVTLSKPIRVASGHQIHVSVRQDTGSTLEIRTHIGGVLL